ncbi:CpaD family pilus assembly protein [Mesorhizobium sp. KR1-2]|uniref:CpaD family pilus assembly protein n=1 Tax=Mesorhizobium sp. KR1-2 TaxID=3156609 RepID=UPI0032B5A36D
MSQARFGKKVTVPALAVLAGVLLGGCAQRDSIVVGAIPDDYRTNHPIVIGEKEQVVDIPVGIGDRGMTQIQRVALKGFLADYDRTAAPLVNIFVPVGTPNSLAATEVGRDFVRFASARGVPAGRIVVSSYQPPVVNIAAPIRVSYLQMRAYTTPCGQWPEDLADTTANKHYANFGCAYQNNLAAQVANPADLLGPRQPTEIDAQRRETVIDGYRRAPFFTPAPRREVEY